MLQPQALRLSLEEEQARQRAAEGSTGSQAPALPTVSETSETNTSAPSNDAGSSDRPGLASTGSMVVEGAEAITGEGHNADNESEESMLQKAILLSQAGASSATKDEDVDMTSADPSEPVRAVVAGEAQNDDDEEMDEDEAIARAIQMSLQEGDDQEDSSK